MKLLQYKDNNITTVLRESNIEALEFNKESEELIVYTRSRIFCFKACTQHLYESIVENLDAFVFKKDSVSSAFVRDKIDYLTYNESTEALSINITMTSFLFRSISNFEYERFLEYLRGEDMKGLKLRDLERIILGEEKLILAGNIKKEILAQSIQDLTEREKELEVQAIYTEEDSIVVEATVEV